MAPTSPTVAQWEYSLRLKRRREELGLSVQQVADHLGFSRNFWSAVENERAVLADDKFDALTDLLDFDPQESTDLRDLRGISRNRTWWTTASQLDSLTKQFVGLEQGASRIRIFESLIVPGLLQTEEYARGYFRSDPMFAAASIDLLVEARMRRQKRLKGTDPLELVVVISEAVLRQQFAGIEVQQAQLAHLASMVRSSDTQIDLRVLPFENNPGPIVASSTLLLMDFGSTQLPVVGWQEAMRLMGPIDDPEQLERLSIAFEIGMEGSLSAQDSLALVESTAR